MPTPIGVSCRSSSRSKASSEAAAARRGRSLLGRVAATLLSLGLGDEAVLEAQEYRTPRAGEAFSATVFGTLVEAPARRRDVFTEVGLGIYGIPNGPEERRLTPLGGALFWRNREDGKERFRGFVVGLYNDLRANSAAALPGDTEGVLTFQNTYWPFDRSEYIEGTRIAAEELVWHQVHAGVGVGYRHTVAPGHQDNALEVALTYEPGALFFARGDETEAGFLVPRDVYEGREHLRLRFDALERNILELPHAGVAAGLDGVAGQRSGWRDWGGSVGGVQPAEAGRNWTAISAYAIVAGPLPFSSAERHRLVGSAYFGTGSDLDRFSAFRLGGGSSAGDWESLSQPLLPGAAIDEFYASHYVIATGEYRYEALFFLYLQLKGSLAWVERARFTDGGGVTRRTEPMHSISGGLTSGFLWNSEIELTYAHNFGILRPRSGAVRSGGSGIVFLFTKEF